MMMKRSSLKTHNLNFTYQEFIQKEKNLVGLKIGEKYKILQKLGQGSFGSVWKGINIDSKQIFAIKVLDLQAIQKEPSAYKKTILKRLIKSEAEMMSICQSPNVIKCFQVYENQSLKMMVIEYCADKDLQTEVNKSKYLSEQDAVKILKQILNGLAQMHQNGIIHRDLKAQNILIHEGVYKIADFGFSKQLSSNSTFNQLMHTKLGTIYTMAPQVLKGSKYGLQADIWSIGIIFYFMLYGKTPYEQNTYEKVLKEIEKKKIFDVKHKNSKFKLSQEAKSFIQKCLTVDSQKRLNWKNIANHKLFSKYQLQESLKSSNKISVSLNKNFMKDLNQKQIIVRNDQEQTIQLRNQKNKQQKTSSLVQFQKNKGQKVSACSTDSPCQWSKEANFQCQITRFIFTQIAEQLQKTSQNFSLKRQIMEIIYLLYTRCFLNMSFRVEDLRNFQQKSISQSVRQQIQRLYKLSLQKFKEYSQKLTKKQSEFLEIIQDKISSFMICTAIQQKDIYLTGIQLPSNRINVLYDYTKQQQIDYTQKVITNSKDLIIQSKILKQKTIKYLLNYQNICTLTLQEAGKAYNLKTYIQSHFCCS